MLRAFFLSVTARSARVLRMVPVSLVVLLASLALGCGDDGGRRKKRVDAGIEKDAGDGTGDFDGNVPLPSHDHDSGVVPPGTPAKGLEGSCAVDSNKIFTVVSGDRPFAGVSLGVDPFASAFAVPYLGASATCSDSVFLATMKGSNAAPGPESQLAIDECALMRSPAVTTADGKWLLAVVDNRLPPWDVWVHTFDADKGKVQPGLRLSDTPGEEKAVTLVTLRDGNVLIAWVDRADTGTSSVRVRALDPSGQPRGDERVLDTWNETAGTDLTKNPQLSYDSLAFTTLGASGAGLAYWRYEPINNLKSEIVFVTLDDKGKPTAPQWVLTHNAGPLGSVDVDSNAEGGAIVYTQAEGTTGRHVWFQEIDDTGKAAPLGNTAGTAAPVRFVGSPSRGIDVSIAKLLVTYTVVYRALPDSPTDRAQLRLQFLSRVGGKLGDSDLGYTSDSGGKTAIESSYDGRAVLSWSEIDVSGKSNIKVARLGCIGR